MADRGAYDLITMTHEATKRVSLSQADLGRLERRGLDNGDVVVFLHGTPVVRAWHAEGERLLPPASAKLLSVLAERGRPMTTDALGQAMGISDIEGTLDTQVHKRYARLISLLDPRTPGRRKPGTGDFLRFADLPERVYDLRPAVGRRLMIVTPLQANDTEPATDADVDSPLVVAELSWLPEEGGDGWVVFELKGHNRSTGSVELVAFDMTMTASNGGLCKELPLSKPGRIDKDYVEGLTVYEMTERRERGHYRPRNVWKLRPGETFVSRLSVAAAELLKLGAAEVDLRVRLSTDAGSFTSSATRWRAEGP